MVLTGHHHNTAGEVSLPRLPAGSSVLSRCGHEGKRFGSAAHWFRIETELALLTSRKQRHQAVQPNCVPISRRYPARARHTHPGGGYERPVARFLDTRTI